MRCALQWPEDGGVGKDRRMQLVRHSTRFLWAVLFAALATGICRADESASAGAETEPAPPSVRRAPPRDPGSFEVPANRLGISPNEPVYFSLGFNEVLNARFQFSLKYRPLGPTDDSVHGEHPWNDIYLAYTQTSVWDLESESKPFYDTSYRPSIFYQRRDLGDLFGGRFSLRTGFEHESNGKGGVDSRSINILFVRPSWWWTLSPRWAVAFSPKAYAYIEKSENEDIADYRGYVDWPLTLARARDLRVTTTLRVGLDGHGSMLVDASYPFSEIPVLRAIGLQNGYLHLQYFDGYGETILSYNRNIAWQLRIGLMLVR